MQGLILRLSALDPEAGAAVRVISYFDALTRQGTGLQGIVRGAALLTGTAAGLVDDERRVRLRVDPDGRCGPATTAPDPSWLTVPVDEGSAVLWLERPGPARTVDEITLERAAAAAAELLTRTRGRAGRSGHDEAHLEVLLDPDAPVADRWLAARRLHLDLDRPARAVAVHAGGPRVEQPPQPNPPDAVATRATPNAQAHPHPDPDTGELRAGVGPWVPVPDLPRSWTAARQALRLTAAGGAEDPGPAIVHFDQLGGLAVLASAVTPDAPPVPDVLAVDAATAAAPWMLATLHALTVTGSQRAAAAHLGIHHSTLQGRLSLAQRHLGWDPASPAGGHRLHLALALRRLHRQH